MQISPPYLLSFAGNPIRYLLRDVANANGIRSVNEINFYGTDTVAGHSATFRAMDHDLTFTLSAAPTGEYDLPVALSGEDRFAWSLRCFNYIKRFCPLVEDYDLEYGAQYATIGFVSKVDGPQYDFLPGSNTINLVSIINLTHGRDYEIVEGVKMQVYKYMGEELPAVLIGEDYKPVEKDGSVRFQVQEYIYSYLLQAPYPRFHNTLESGIHNTFQDYIMSYIVVFINKIDGEFEQRTYYDTRRYAIPGGLSRHDLVKNNLNNVDYFSLPSNQKRFMTWLPSGKPKITDQQSKESLFFLFQEPQFVKYKLMARLWSDTGSSITISLMEDFCDIIPWTVVEFLVGFSSLTLDAFAQGSVAKWMVYLVNEDDEVISDEFTFELDDRYSEYTRYFRFRNSWGAYDSLRCTGAFETNLEHEIEKVSFISDEIETPFNASGSNSINRETLTFTANSGWIPREFLLYLRDFKRSLDFYEIVNSHILKCVFTSKKTKLLEDKNYNYALSFEYERAWEDEFYSNT